MQITKTISIDNFVLGVIVCVTLAGIGIYHLAMYTSSIQDEAFTEIEQMGCGELKEFITEEKWKESPARNFIIRDKALHLYEWTCEK